VVGLILSDAGYGTVEAVDGIDALKKITEGSVHMIIRDVNMPNMDGITFVREIKKQKKHKPRHVLMLNTENRPHKREECREAGATAWIVKPFRPDQILNAVQKLMH